MYDELNKLDELSRRKFMQYSAKALLGVGLSASTTPLWASQTIKKPTARNVIYIYLSGGMSHIDTFDPKPNWKDQGPVQTIDTNVAGIQISEYLPSLAKRAEDDRTKFRRQAIWFTVSLVLILSSIPWPFRAGFEAYGWW